MEKFDSISRLKRGFYDWEDNDVILITEKLDGADASIRIKYDSNGNILEHSIHSKGQQLSESNTLRGFYNYATNILLPRLSDALQATDLQSMRLDSFGEVIIFGEWLVPHTVKYKDYCYDKFYPFALFNVETGQYESPYILRNFADMLEVTTPKTLYFGRFGDISLEQMLEIVGKSPMTLDLNGGEGIVVWNTDCDDNDNCRVEIISDKYKL